MVAEVLLQCLLALAIALLNVGLSKDEDNVLWGLGVLFQAWQVVLQYLQIVIVMLSGGFPWCCR